MPSEFFGWVAADQRLLNVLLFVPIGALGGFAAPSRVRSRIVFGGGLAVLPVIVDNWMGLAIGLLIAGLCGMAARRGPGPSSLGDAVGRCRR